jgi:hypothetical protein
LDMGCSLFDILRLDGEILPEERVCGSVAGTNR